MSASLDAPGRRPTNQRLRLASLAALPLILALLVTGVASAERPSTAIRVSPADAARGGLTVGFIPHVLGASTLIEVHPSANGPASGPGGSLLAVSADGSVVALADQIGEPFGSLTIAHADGSQLRVTLPGLLSAGFALNGSWLAVLDSQGALWQVDAESGVVVRVADGPFLGSPIAAADGSLMLLSVSSAEAPYRSRLVRVVLSSGETTLLSSDELVYAAFPLSDGSVAAVVHEPGGTMVRKVGPGGPALLADLGVGAINVAVAPLGLPIAFEIVGRGIFVIDRPGSSPRSFGPGSHPCFAADASSVLTRRGDTNVALSMDGSVLAVVDRLAAFAGAVGCLS